MIKSEYNSQQPNQFTSVMTTRTDEQLEITVNASQGDYDPEAIQAAKQEKVRREMVKIELSELSDEDLLDFLKQKKHHAIDKDYAREEAKKRNLKIESNHAKKGITVFGVVVIVYSIYKLIYYLVIR